MSTTFHIDEEIDKLIDKFTDELRIRIKKAIIRSEKLVLKQYIASQRETVKATKSDKPNLAPNKAKVAVQLPSPKATPKATPRGSPRGSPKPSLKDTPKSRVKIVHRREQDYNYISDSD